MQQALIKKCYEFSNSKKIATVDGNMLNALRLREKNHFSIIKRWKKLFLDWIRNEISFIYRNENQIMQQVSSNNLDDSGFSLTQLLSVTFHALFSEFIFTIFADISISPSLLAAHKKKNLWHGKKVGKFLAIKFNFEDVSLNLAIIIRNIFNCILITIKIVLHGK